MSRERCRWRRVLRSAGSALLVTALGLSACRRATRSAAATSASAPPPATAFVPLPPVTGEGRYVGVEQRRLADEPILFHPALPIAGQILHDACDLWDLDMGVSRGRVPAAECASWPPSRPAARLDPERYPRLPGGKRWFVDSRERYAGFLPLTPLDIEREWGIYALADQRLRVSTVAAPGRPYEVASRVLWAADGASFFRFIGPHPDGLPLVIHPSAPQVRFVDLRAGTRWVFEMHDGALERAAVSPDGRCVAFATIELGPSTTSIDAIAPEPRERRPRVRAWCPDRSAAASWTQEREVEDLVWSAGSDAVALVGKDGTWLMSVAPGAPPPDAHAMAARPRPGSRSVDELGLLDPSGRFEVWSGEEDVVVRRADGETLHAWERGLFTAGYLYAREPPPEWVFRDGPDAIHGRLVRAADAAFLSPTPDLGARFLAGERLPHRYTETPRAEHPAPR